VFVLGQKLTLTDSISICSNVNTASQLARIAIRPMSIVRQALFVTSNVIAYTTTHRDVRRVIATHQRIPVASHQSSCIFVQPSHSHIIQPRHSQAHHQLPNLLSHGTLVFSCTPCHPLISSPKTSFTSLCCFNMFRPRNFSLTMSMPYMEPQPPEMSWTCCLG
jgi:hypothetical protein